MENRHTYDNVTAEELAEARLYVMEIEWSPEDEVFVVSFPDAPGVMTHGATRDEAAAMGEDAIITWLTGLRDACLPVPPPSIKANHVTVERPPAFDSRRIQKIRRGLDVSQRVFAEMLNVSLATVRSWEQGARTPDGAATRLLSIAERHPETIIESASPAVGKPDRQTGEAA
jgi:putative transcriptional regulator